MLNAAAFSALADPQRLAILDALRAGEHPVNDLVGRVKIHQSGVSRHLRILSGAGFVRVRPDGARRLYSLKREPFLELEAWLNRFRATWNDRLDRLGGELERRKAAREGKKR
jgi:DNA-binding transcriptional ArsR family regulator